MSQEELGQSEKLYADIKPRLRALADMSEADLPNEMQSLRTSLLKNPDACALMLPEEIGMLVTALCRETGKTLAAAKIKATKTTKPKALKAVDIKKLSAEEYKNALDEL